MALDRAQQTWPEDLTQSLITLVDDVTKRLDNETSQAQDAGESEMEYLRRTR